MKSHGEIRQINGKRVASTEYRSWTMMKNRCLNPKADDYKYYGARGITICTEWLTFEGFLADMGRKLRPELTLERKNSDGNYEVNNCEWATRQTQSRNRRFASAKSWKLAEELGVTQQRASLLISAVRAKDRGSPIKYYLPEDKEVEVRAYLKRNGL